MMSEEGLRRVIEALDQRLSDLETSHRAEEAGGVESLAFAGLPVAGQAGRVVFVTDGRKVGEGPGAGTGVLAYDDGGVSWRRPSDDTVVLT